MNGFDIAINYPKTIMQANKLKRIAGDCRDVKKDVHKQISYIEDNWLGKTGDSLADKLRLLEKKTESVADKLEDVAETIKSIANMIKELDEASSERIENMK